MKKIIKKHFRFKNQKAMTLLELIIYITLTMIILVIIIDLITQVGAHKKQHMGESVVTQSSIFLLNRFQYSVGQSKAIETAEAGNLLSLTTGTEERVFSLSEGKIYEQAQGGEAIPLTPDLIEIVPVDPESPAFTKFTNAETPSVLINFMIKNKNTGFKEEFNLISVAKGR